MSPRWQPPPSPRVGPVGAALGRSPLSRASSATRTRTQVVTSPPTLVTAPSGLLVVNTAPFEDALAQRMSRVSTQWRSKLADARIELAEVKQLEEALALESQAQIAELERELARARESDEARLRQVVNLERELVSCKEATRRQAEQRSTLHIQVAALEQELIEVRVAGERHHQQTVVLRARVAELEAALATATRSAEANELLYKQIAELQQEVAEARNLKDRLGRQTGLQRQSISVLESELSDLRARQEGIPELERELAASREREEELKRRLAEALEHHHHHHTIRRVVTEAAQ